MVLGFFWQLQSLPRNNKVKLYFFFYQLLVMIVFKKIQWLYSLYASIEFTGSTCIYMFWFKRKHVSVLLKSEPPIIVFSIEKTTSRFLCKTRYDR